MGSTDLKPADATGPEDEDHTIVVDSDATRYIRRKVPREKETDRDEDDGTVAINRSASGTSSPPTLRAPRKRGIVSPPVPKGFAPLAVKGTGADATERYGPRVVPTPLTPLHTLAEGLSTTRESPSTMPSVARHGRGTARAAIAAFVVSCVASVVGLTLIALALLARR